LQVSVASFTRGVCSTFARPQHVESMTYESLKTEFRDEYVVLERQVFNAVANARRLSGRLVNGEICRWCGACLC
jgi:hypothetical protein